MSNCSSVSCSSDSDQDIDIEADSPKRVKVITQFSVVYDCATLLGIKNVLISKCLELKKLLKFTLYFVWKGSGIVDARLRAFVLLLCGV